MVMMAVWAVENVMGVLVEGPSINILADMLTQADGDEGADMCRRLMAHYNIDLVSK